MSSFCCPHLEMEKDYCLRLRTDCVPGRPGCVLQKNTVFAVPAKERIREKLQARNQQADKQ